MKLKMPRSPLASPPRARQGSTVMQRLLVLFLLIVLTGAHARAGPEANPKAKPQNNDVENYNEYNEYGEDIYGESITNDRILHFYSFSCATVKEDLLSGASV